jgi:hypothetical protein
LKTLIDKKRVKASIVGHNFVQYKQNSYETLSVVLDYNFLCPVKVIGETPRKINDSNVDNLY